MKPKPEPEENDCGDDLTSAVWVDEDGNAIDMDQV